MYNRRVFHHVALGSVLYAYEKQVVSLRLRVPRLFCTVRRDLLFPSTIDALNTLRWSSTLRRSLHIVTVWRLELKKNPEREALLALSSIKRLLMIY